MPSKRAKSGRAKKRRMPFDVFVRRAILCARRVRTWHLPGTPGKLRVMRLRARLGLPLHVHGDPVAENPAGDDAGAGPVRVVHAPRQLRGLCAS